MKTKVAGFSLIEVVVAVGVAAVGITAVLGLMAAVAKSTAEARARVMAENVVQRAIVEVERRGYADVLARLVPAGESATEAQQFYFDRAGNLLESTATERRFYAVQLARIDSVSPASQDADSAVVAFTVRVAWPIHESAPSFSLSLNHALLR